MNRESEARASVLGSGIRVLVEAMLTIDPFRSREGGTACFAQRKAPVRLTARTRFHVSMLIRSGGSDTAVAIPALLITMLILANSSIVRYGLLSHRLVGDVSFDQADQRLIDHRLVGLVVAGTPHFVMILS